MPPKKKYLGNIRVLKNSKIVWPRIAGVWTATQMESKHRENKVKFSASLQNAS